MSIGELCGTTRRKRFNWREVNNILGPLDKSIGRAFGHQDVTLARKLAVEAGHADPNKLVTGYPATARRAAWTLFLATAMRLNDGTA